MLLRVLQRFLVLVASLAVASVLVFAFMQVLPGDPARIALGMNSSEESVARLREQFGLDRPLLVQYADWLRGLFTLDLGVEWVSKAPIAPQLVDRFAVTAWLVGVSMILALVIALPVGTWMAVRHRHADGVALSALSQVGVAVPAFLAGIILITYFSKQLQWFPSGGWVPPAQDPVEFLRRLALPAISLALVQASVLARYVRSAVLDVLREDYLRTARAKGLRPMQALTRHGLRNAAVPIVTILGLQLATLLIGAVVVERVFVIPGLGSFLLDSVASRELITVQTIVMVLVAAVLIINFLVDTLYLLIDPRLRTGAR
ncbi:ABC transporter permease [Ornithinimicrobium ciconiae]|uniref:ABC transporter permease n=1 Tax=Ornithinimicrobium ciconiae TaxID=2594265 RepID=A0A516G784_9MICO|nr:ABC transporter permease [Ornithinimicrobium ciconiae]QDO87332.1 ABC transporter permease [Ornithinimicrobium ciconiae]